MSQAAIEFEDFQLDEEWRNIPGYPGYQASSLGRIRSSVVGSYIILKPTIRGRGYLAVTLNTSETGYVHRLLLITFFRLPLEGEECDHINRIRTDNRLENLRWVSASENMANRKNWGASKLKGVAFLHLKWTKKDGTYSSKSFIRSSIRINKKNVNLGYFKTEEEAHEAYKTAYKNHYGYEYQD
jgi:hypothetical protein